MATVEQVQECAVLIKFCYKNKPNGQVLSRMYHFEDFTPPAIGRTRSWVFGDEEKEIYSEKLSLGGLSRPYSNYSDQNPEIRPVMSFFGSEETLTEAVSIITDSVSQIFCYFMQRTCASTVLQYMGDRHDNDCLY